MINSLITGTALALLALSTGVAGDTARTLLSPVGVAGAGCASTEDCSTLGSRVASNLVGNARGSIDSVSGTKKELPMAQAVPDTARGADSAYVPAGYVKVFGDEFDEIRLDTAKWWTRYIYADGTLDFLNDEQQRYREDRNHVMTGHSLVLMARKSAGADGYQSGMIRSKTTFKYGYFEARMKVPAGIGVRPAFWLNSTSRASDGKIAWPPEIDIAELANNGVEDTTRMLHVGLVSNGPQKTKTIYAAPEFNQDWNYWSAPGSLADEFHVYSALWDSDDTVSISIDGRLFFKGDYKWVYDDGSPAGYANVILDLAIGGAKWAGRHGIDASAFPQGLEVDYLRVYQKVGEQKIGTDMVGKELCPPEGGGGC